MARVPGMSAAAGMAGMGRAMQVGRGVAPMPPTGIPPPGMPPRGPPPIPGLNFLLLSNIYNILMPNKFYN